MHTDAVSIPMELLIFMAVKYPVITLPDGKRMNFFRKENASTEVEYICMSMLATLRN